ncbi:MAG: HAD-IA family hydrolase, partial [Anaerolineales bacterium]
MSIQAVLFDMGGTIETYGYTRQFRIKATHGLQKILSTAGIDLHLSNEQLYEVVSDGLKRYHDLSLVNLDEYPSFIVWRDYVFNDFAVDLKVLERISEELMCYIETDYFYRDIRPEVPSVLETIKQMGYKIGMISNVNSRGQVPTNLKKYGIIDYFDPIVLSSEYGRRKPDPAIFHYAARLANVPTSKCLFVGDRVIRDVIGAQKAGYGMVVQINHDYDHGEDDSGPAPDAVIDNMDQLVDILKKDAASDTNNVVQDQQIKALVFDAGDILYFRPEKGRNLREFLADNAIEVKDISESTLLELKKKAFTGAMTQDQKRKEILKEYGVSDTLLIEKGCLAMEQDDNFVDFFEGVRSTLISLKEMGYLLGIITDTANPLYVKLQWFEKGG